MNCQLRIRTKNAVILLSVFLLGAMLSILKHETFSLFFSDKEFFFPLVVSFLLIFSSQHISSLSGLRMLLLTSFLLGICTELWIYRLRLGYSSGEEAAIEAFMLILLVPFHFCICGIGMEQSLKIREVLRIKKKTYINSLFTSYTIMVLAAAIVFLLLRYIINI